jgi:hypothetical protein
MSDQPGLFEQHDRAVRAAEIEAALPIPERAVRTTPPTSNVDLIQDCESRIIMAGAECELNLRLAEKRPADSFERESSMLCASNWSAYAFEWAQVRARAGS